MHTVFSFDVFDTLLTRTVLNPKDVFDLVDSSLSNDSNNNLEVVSKNFRPIRVWAEFLARRKSLLEDVDIATIYQELGRLNCLDKGQTDLLMDVELSVEREVLFPVDGAVELVESARQRGRVVFVSDMYLPSIFISEILDRFGLRGGNEKVYVSGEIGLTKGSGRLFRKIIEDYNVNAAQMIHCGDHPSSDHAVPLKIGICVQPKERRRPGCFRYSRLLYACELLKARLQIGWKDHV